MDSIMSMQSQEADGAARTEAGRRPVRSFVRRAGRLTEAQRRALDELLPRFGVDPEDRVLNFEELFGNDRPVILEIGFGNGEVTWRVARAHPEQNFLAVEVHEPGIGRLLLALEREGIDNVRVACADAVAWLRDRVGPRSLDGVRIYFPDPWPKKRHHKRRLIQAGFLELLASRMKPGAILHLATDWAPYAEHMLEVVNGSPYFENLSRTGGGSPRPDWRPRTKYEQRGERLGHRVIDLLLRRTAHGEAG
jgi:tRNA (guanine-N7-)-methyltransferase